MTFNAEAGMTWAEWVNSEYNDYGINIHLNSYPIFHDNCNVKMAGSSASDVKPNDGIIADYCYKDLYYTTDPA